MSDRERKLWPFRPRTSIAAAILLLVALLLIIAALRATIQWPGQQSETTILIGILLLSLLPILLAIVDVVIDRGGVIEYGGVKIDFSQVQKMETPGITVPVNIGAPGQQVSDSGTTEILDALRKATTSDTVIIDLEEGQAWWETRLLVLLAGAVRLKKPGKVVFVGTDGGITQCFQGWGYAGELLPCLLQAHPQYPMSYHKALAASRQWEMVEPIGTGNTPPPPNWIVNGLAAQHTWMAFNGTTGLPNPLLAEQFLAHDLGVEVESKEQPKRISLVRLEELFRPVLHKENVEETSPAEEQLSAFFNSDSPYIGITGNGKYKTLASRISVLNTIVRSLVEKKKKNN
jgi:hypothetical protein